MRVFVCGAAPDPSPQALLRIASPFSLSNRFMGTIRPNWRGWRCLLAHGMILPQTIVISAAYTRICLAVDGGRTPPHPAGRYKTWQILVGDDPRTARRLRAASEGMRAAVPQQLRVFQQAEQNSGCERIERILLSIRYLSLIDMVEKVDPLL